LGGKPRKYVGAGRPEETIRLEAQAKALDKIIERELGILCLKPNMRVLDAGCGTGAVTRKIASKVFPAETFGIDIDPLFVDKAKKTALDKGAKNIHFELGNIDSLTYDDGFFDMSYCRLVLMHVKNPVKTIAELRRVTRKDGIVAASDNDDGAILIYPPAPRFFSLWERYGEWAKARGEDRYIGRKLYSIFLEAGLRSIKIYPLPTFATQREPDVLRMLVYVLVDILELHKDAMIKEGVATAKDYEEAVKEIETVLRNAGTFLMGCFFLAVGECSSRARARYGRLFK
jgi:ubiquinone/menaquinone biosynthesis C-methylase UbiE